MLHNQIKRNQQRTNVEFAKNLVFMGGAAGLEFVNRQFLSGALPFKGLRRAVTKDVISGKYDGPLRRYMSKHFRSGRMEPESELMWLMLGTVGGVASVNLFGEAGRGLFGGPGGAQDAARRDAEGRKSAAGDTPIATSMKEPSAGMDAPAPFERPQSLPPPTQRASAPSEPAAAPQDARIKELEQKMQQMAQAHAEFNEMRRSQHLEMQRREEIFNQRVQQAQAELNQRAQQIARNEAMLEARMQALASQ